MKLLNRFSLRKWKSSSIILLLLVGSQLLLACGAGETSTNVVQSAAATTPKISPTVVPSPTPTVKPLDVANRNPGIPIPTAQINQAKQGWLQLLDRNEQLWKSKNVSAYEIEVSYHNTPWPPGEVYNLTVRTGQVVQAAYSLTACFSCSDKTLPTPNPAKRTYQDYTELTVPGLFKWSRSLVAKEWNEETAFQVKFNPYYGFPAEIVLDNHRFTDIGRYWKVESFKELT